MNIAQFWNPKSNRDQDQSMLPVLSDILLIEDLWSLQNWYFLLAITAIFKRI